MAYGKIRPRRGTLYEWSTINPILYEGEFAVEFPDSGIGTGLCRFKIGDGFTAYNDLPYAFDANAAQAIYGGNAYEWKDIVIRSDTYDNWMAEDPILKKGEISYDETKKKIKIGDGIHYWSETRYMGVDFDEGVYDFGFDDETYADYDPEAAII